MSGWRVVGTGAPGYGAPVYPSPRELMEGGRWPRPHTFVVRVQPPDADYLIDVEVEETPEGDRVVTGLAVRTAPRMRPVSWNRVGGRKPVEPSWPSDVRPSLLSTRDARRVPFSTAAALALAVLGGKSREELLTLASDPEKYRENYEREVQRAVAPRGRPSRTTDFYLQFADAYRALAAEGKNPAQEIARRKKVSRNLVHQWTYQARKLGFLEEPPTSRRRKGG